MNRFSKILSCGQLMHCLHSGNAIHIYTFNSLPFDKILDWSKFKAYADNKINVTEKLKFVLGSVENIVGKGKNAGTSILSFSYNVFKGLLIQGR